MKWKPGKKQVSIMLSVIICAIVIILFYYVLFNGSKIAGAISSLISILAPVITGCVIAYILTPVLNFIESRWLYPVHKMRGIDLKKPEHRKKRKNIRKISVLLTMGFAAFILYAMLMVLIPQLVRSINEIIRNFPYYITNLQKYVDKYLNDNPRVRSTVDNLIQTYSSTVMEMFKSKVIPNISTVISTVSKSMMSAIQIFLYLVVGVIVAIYVLNSKELFMGQAKKLCYAFMKKESANEVIGAFRYAHYTFTGFVIGKLVDSLIIGIITFIFCEILKIPYAVLLSFVVGLTNIIPFFGPYIGAFFGAILLIMINPLKALVFLLLIMIIQQFDGNILGPIILGNSTGLSSFWVIFAILVFGGVFGPIGWLIGVPTFACIYTFIGYVARKRLKEKKLPRDTSSYIDAAYIDDDGITNIEDADNSKYYVHNESSSLRRMFKFYKKGKSYIETVVPMASAKDETEDINDSAEDDVKKDQESKLDNEDNIES